MSDINYDWNLKHSMDDFKKLQEERIDDIEEALYTLVSYLGLNKQITPPCRGKYDPRVCVVNPTSRPCCGSVCV